MKILIDTNIFLDFYRHNNHPVETFNNLKENYTDVILTDQIIMEFDRNRESVIKDLRKKFEMESMLDNFSSSYVQSLDEFKELIALQKSYRSKQKDVLAKIDEMLKDPSKDPIAKLFQEFVVEINKNNSVYATTPEIIERAEKRKKLGNPPASDKYSIGDEINWETVLENVKEDIIIVGRDSTYANNFSFLQRDFHKRTGFFIQTLTKSIFEALILIGAKPSAEVIENEQKMIQEIRPND